MSRKIREMEEEVDRDAPHDGGIVKYNPAKFVIPAQDHQGHSERVWARIQPLLDRQLDKILASKRFPFRVKGDIIRFAIMQAVELLDKLEPMPGLIGRINAIAEIVRQEEYFHAMQASLDNLAQLAERHISSGAEGEARRLVALAKAEAERIEEPYWRDKYLDDLSRRLGHLLRATKGASGAHGE